MNAPLAVAVREADLADPREVARLDAFVADHPDSTLFHRPQWSLAVERGAGQRACCLVAERGGILVGALPLTRVRSRLFGDALVSAGFATGGGIVGEGADRLAAAASSLAQRLGSGSVELRGGPLPEGWDRREGVHARFDRALPGDEKALLAAIPRRQRAEVRRALGFGLQVEEGRGEAHRAAHHRVYAESVRNLGTPVFPRALFDAALDAFGDSGWIVLVSKGGRPLAAMLGFDFKGVAHPYWGGGTAGAKRWRANDLIYFEVMRRAIARGCTRADFGRSRVGSGPWKRKRIWDCAETPLVYGVRAAGGAGARAVDPDSPRYRLQVAAWRRLPLWLANRLGPPIARGLG